MTAMALSGTVVPRPRRPRPVWMRASQDEQGRPRSRAKAQIMREPEVRMLMVATKQMKTRGTVMPVVAALELVAFLN